MSQALIADTMEHGNSPRFEIDPVQLQFELHNKLKHLCVQANIMYIILDRQIFKINLENPAVVKRFQFASDATINNAWLSPNGQHLIVQVNGTNYFYLHEKYEKFKTLPRLKGLEIVSVVFHSDVGTESTGDFLLVTKDNAVHISHIKCHFGQDNKKDDKYVKQAYKARERILGVCFSNNDTRIEIFVPSAILQWDCFEPSVNEMLRLFKLAPQTVESPVVDGALESTGNAYVLLSSSNELVSDDYELGLSKISKLPMKLSDKLVISKHHIFILSYNLTELIVFSKLSDTPPQIIELPLQMLSVTADYTTGTFWLYGNDTIHEILIENEGVNVWYHYYKMGNYEEALKVLDTSSSKDAIIKKDMVLIKQGYDYLQKGSFGLNFNDRFDSNLIALQTKGLKILARLSEPFEKVCLMLMNLQNVSGSSNLNNSISQKLLIDYLKVKFDELKKSGNRIRQVALSSWIIELMLRNVYNLENETKFIDTTLGVKQGGHEIKKKLMKELNDDFHSFLDTNHKILDKDTVYQIMSQLNYQSKLVYFAELNQDYDYILTYYVDLEDWKSCLKVLMSMYSANVSSFEDSLLKTASVLLLNYPAGTIETWLKFPDINYEKLLLSLLIYNKKNSRVVSVSKNHTITFLQKLIFTKNVKNKTINNYYLLLLITYPNPDEDDKQLINKHILKVLNHIKLDSKFYDSGLILRLCLDYSHIQPAVMILVHDLRLFDQALKLSIDHDLPDLAIYVLERYNRYIDNNLELEDDNDLELDVTTEVTPKLSNKFVDLSKNKLHHKDFTQGKKLWMLFAKYLIDGVMKGREFDFIGNEQVDESNGAKENGTNVTHEANGAKGGETNGDTHSSGDHFEVNGAHSVSNDGNGNVAKDLARELAGNSVDPPADLPTLMRANRVLKYLLDSSFNSSINSTFVNLKDLLQLFPESVMVNNFKDEIIRSLDQYNSKINQLSIEMKESLGISEKLNNQIKDINNQVKNGKIFTIVEPGEPCGFCNKLLINKNFVVFPNCHHNFHKDCLVKYYLMVKGDYRFRKVFQDFKKNGASNKKELDDIMMAECVLCNESNILTIDNNLIDPVKNKEEIDLWQL